MTTYKTIIDEAEYDKFIAWLPDLEDDECYYYSLLARDKYIRDLGIGTFHSDKHQPTRFTINNKDRLKIKLRQTECALGAYECNGVSIPQEALASYISINPRSQMKAARCMLREMCDVVIDGKKNLNVYQESLTALHKSIAYKRFVDIDFDGVDMETTCKEISKHINPSCATIIQTRGGFHVLVRLSEVEPEYVKSWYRNIQKLDGADIVGDNLVPICGTYQGGWVPRMYKMEEIL